MVGVDLRFVRLAAKLTPASPGRDCFKRFVVGEILLLGSEGVEDQEKEEDCKEEM